MSDEAQEESPIDKILREAKERTEEILDEVERLTAIDTDNLDIAYQDSSKNMSKLQRLYWTEGTKLKGLQDTQKSIKLQRWKHYSGKMPSAHYAKNPLQEAVQKTDLPMYIDADPLVQNMNKVVAESEVRIKAIETAIKVMASRGYDIKALIDYKKFTSGT